MSKKHYQVEVRIQADLDDIWGLLTDASNYHRWNSTVKRANGTIDLGKRLTLIPNLPKSRAVKVRVTEYLAPHRMVWSGGKPLGLFRGVRTFSLERERGAVTFRMEESFSGPLSGLICKMIPDLTESFNQFAADLKSKAESMA
jgi:hypothetical protein